VQGACQRHNSHEKIRESMKIPKIIGIKKSFTSLPHPFQAADTPATRVIIPSWWGASPHVLGEGFERRGPLIPVCSQKIVNIHVI
jgi:hypothetical protein